MRQISKHQLLSVVSIKVYDTTSRKASDAMFSGVVVDKDGHILSSAHTTMPGQVYQITFPDGKIFMAKGLGRILAQDAALLKIIGGGVWPFSEMGLSDSLKENDLCIGISYIGSLGQSKPTVRFGYVIEPVTENGSFRSTCLMEPGDSGGPVFDLLGKVIGIHSRIEVATDRNFEVPIAVYRKYWKALSVPKTYQDPPEIETIAIAHMENKPQGQSDFQNINHALKKNEGDFQKNVVSLVSLHGGAPYLTLSTLIRLKGHTAGNKRFLVSKSSAVGDNPVVLLNNERIQTKILKRDEATDLVLLEFEAKLKNDPGLIADKAPSGDVGKFLISVLPEREGYLSVLGNINASVQIPPYPGFLRASVEMKNGHVVVKDTLSTNPFTRSVLKMGDQLLSINDKEIKIPADLFTETSRYLPGHQVKLVLIRAGKRLEQNIYLSSITDFVLHIADQFGGKSKRRYGFKQVFVHDGQLQPWECGGPVFDVNGNFYGINIARFSRTSTLAVPVNVVSDFVGSAF